MNEKDFYSLCVGQTIYYKSEKKEIDSLRHWTKYSVKEQIGFKGVEHEEEMLYFKDIMHDLSFEAPFEIKEDCKHREPAGEPFCMHKNGFINQLDSYNCYNCPDYEKKKEVVRYYAVPVKVEPAEYHMQFVNYDKDYCYNGSSGKHTPIKVCPETNRIFIEIEE